jgi:hypothetical protein
MKKILRYGILFIYLVFNRLRAAEVEQNDTQSGNFQVIQYTKNKGETVDFQHTAIFKNDNDLVYGNLPADQLKSVSSSYWRRGSSDTSTTDWYIVTGEQNSRWNVLNPANMPKLPIQPIPVPPVPLLEVPQTNNQ